MSSYTTPYNNIVKLKRNSIASNIYDIEIGNAERLKLYDSVECHIVLYPYNRNISSHSFTFNPFEEYAKDISSRQRSVYVQISSQFNKAFGFVLVALIAALFWIFKPIEFFSVEYLVSILWAYLIGKEIGDDVEKALINISKSCKLRFVDSYYAYELEKGTTLATYSNFAKQRRYGVASLLPTKFDFIEQSNSQTVRMYFDKGDLQALAGSSAHVLSMHVEPSLVSDFEKDGYMLSVKLSFNSRVLGVNRCFEIFQSLDKGSKGCLDEKGEWHEGSIFYRHTYVVGRIKYYSDKGLLSRETIFE
jgi:hypothetical protein